jgi:TPR repeat protein
VGAHPALNFQLRKVTDNNTTTNITQMRRFLAGEIAPTYHINKNWHVGIYYLQGHGLQKDGPQATHFITFNSGINNIKMGGPLRLALYGAVYYLELDGYEGHYYTATTTLSHKKIPFSLQAAMNKTIRSTLPGNKDFLSTVTLFYNFSKTMVRVK